MLITLAVIGIVASMTIPALMNNVGDTQIRAQLKSVFSDLSQATMSIVNDNDGSLAGVFTGDWLGSEAFKNSYKAKMNTIKDCSGVAAYGGTGAATSTYDCWSATDRKLLNNDDVPLAWTIETPAIVLNNGVSLRFLIGKSDCSEDTSFADGDYARCGWIEVDVNGNKPPNKYGVDTFAFSVTSNNIIPVGARGFYEPSTDCDLSNGSGTNNGFGCSAKYLYD